MISLREGMTLAQAREARERAQDDIAARLYDLWKETGLQPKDVHIGVKQSGWAPFAAEGPSPTGLWVNVELNQL